MALTTTLVRQAAAIPIRAGRVCLVTSRRNKRWVIPKGCLEEGMTSGQIALQEAWEEAGLSGVLEPTPVGRYVYEKSGSTCLVTVFLMRVSAVADVWPEQGQRGRAWVRFEEALAWLKEPGLREVVRTVREGERLAIV